MIEREEVQTRLRSASRHCEQAQREYALPGSNSDTQTRRASQKALTQPDLTLRNRTGLYPEDIGPESHIVVHMGLYHYTPRPSPENQYIPLQTTPNETTLISKS